MTNKLYVGNLPFSADEPGLRAAFGSDGRQCTSVKIMMDRETGRSRGFAFVEMASPEDAQKAIDVMHGQDFQGRPLTVNEAREQAPRGPGAGFGGRPSGAGGGRPGGGFSSGPSSGAPSRGPIPNGPGGPPPRSDHQGGGRSSGGYQGGGGGFSPPAGFDAPPAEGAAKRGRDHKGGKDKDRRRNGKGDDW